MTGGHDCRTAGGLDFGWMELMGDASGLAARRRDPLRDRARLM